MPNNQKLQHRNSADRVLEELDELETRWNYVEHQALHSIFGEPTQ